MSRHNLSYGDFVSQLQVFLHDIDKDTFDLENIDQILMSAGYDPTKIGQEMLSFANQAMDSSPHNWRARAHRNQEQARENYRLFRSEKSNMTRTDLLRAIQSLITQNNIQVTTAYRDLENLTDRDLESMLTQLEFLAAQKHLSED
jgi:hypothetical protein